MWFCVCYNTNIRPADSGFSDVTLSKHVQTFGDMDGGCRHELNIVNSVHNQTSMQWALLSSFPGIKQSERVADHSLYIVPSL